MKHCKNCGAEITDEELICPRCGFAGEEIPAESEEVTDASEADESVEAVTEMDEAEEVEAEEAEEAEAEETVTEAEEAEAEIADAEEAESDETDEAEETEAEEAATEADETESAETEVAEEAEAAPEKPKNRWSWVATVAVIATVLIVAGLAAFILHKNGTLQKWYDDIRPKTKSACTMEDYSEIQVLRSSVEVTDETVENYVASLLGTEATDKDVVEYASTHSECDASTLEEFREYGRNYIYSYYLHNEMMEYLKSITTVTSYDEEDEAMLKDYAAEELEYYASYYGTDTDTLATYSGFESADAYQTETAHDYQLTAMILDKVMQDKGISYTEEEFRSALEDYLDENGYTAYYTYDEFLEEAGDAWVYLYENLTYKFDMVTKVLEPNVVLIDEPEE